METTPRDEQWERIHALSSRLDALTGEEVARELELLERAGEEDRLVMSFLRTNYRLEPPAYPPGEGDVLAGRYKVIEKLGEGGMGTVFRAHHDLTRRDVAVKLVHPTLVQSPHARERFLSEISLQAKLNHPGIVRVFDADVHEPENAPGKPHVFLAMELVEGRTLPDYVEENQLGVPDVLHLVERVALAIGHAHASGILHLDIKPPNILVREVDGSPVVLDFGLAAAIDSGGGSGGGTLAYMAPEVVRDPSSGGTVAADVYATGVVLYELLAGNHPYLQEGTENLRGRICEGSRPRMRVAAPGLPLGVADLVEKAMALGADERFASMGAMAEALKKARLALENAAAYRRGIVRAALVSSGIVAMVVALAAAAWVNAKRARTAAADAALGEARALAVSSQGAAVARGLETVRSISPRGFEGGRAAALRDAVTALLARDDIGLPVPSRRRGESPVPLLDAGPGVISWLGTEFSHAQFPFVRRAGRAAASASGGILATTSPDSHHVLLWDAASGRLVAFAYHPALPVSVDWGGSDTTLVVGTSDGRVLFWEFPEVFPADRKPVRIAAPIATIDGPPGGLRAAAYHFASGAVAMLGEAGTTFEFEHGTGDRRQQLELPTPCERLVFSSDGLQLTASGPAGEWQLPVLRSPILQRIRAGAAHGVGTAFAAPSQRLVLVDGENLRLFSLAPLRQLGSKDFGLGRILDVDGDRVALDGRDAAALFDASQSDLENLVVEAVPIPAEGSRYFPLVDPSHWFTLKNQHVHFPEYSLELSSEIVDGQFLTGSATIGVTTHDGVYVIRTKGEPTVLRHFPQATSFAQGTMHLYIARPGAIDRIEPGRFTVDGTFPLPGGAAPGSLTYIPGRDVLALPDGRGVLLLNARDGSHAVRLPLLAAPAEISASADGRNLAAVGRNSVLSLWDLDTLATELAALGLPLNPAPGP